MPKMCYFYDKIGKYSSAGALPPDPLVYGGWGLLSHPLNSQGFTKNGTQKKLVK